MVHCCWGGMLFGVVKSGGDQRCGWEGDAADGEGWEWA